MSQYFSNPKNTYKKETRKTLVIYRPESDSRTSAAIVQYFDNSAKLLKSNYGQRLPREKIKEGGFDCVFLLDFSLSKPDMDWLCENYTVIYIDHNLKQVPVQFTSHEHYFITSDEKCCCELTWDTCNRNNLAKPAVVKWVADYHKWKFEFNETLLFHYGMEFTLLNNPTDEFRYWYKLLCDDKNEINRILDVGKCVKNYVDKISRILANDLVYITTLDNLNIAVANTRFSGSSKLFDSIDKTNVDILALVGYSGSLGVWRTMLFQNNPNVDVGLFASKHGGGGRSTVGSMSTKEYPFPIEPVSDNTKIPLKINIPNDYVVQKYHKENLKTSYNLQYFTTLFEGLDTVVINCDLDDRDIFLNIKNPDILFAISFSYIKTGWYRIHIYPISCIIGSSTYQYWHKIFLQKYSATVLDTGDFIFLSKTLPFKLEKRLICE